MEAVEPSRGPRGQRRGRGARERILAATERLFREQGINSTGMDQLCAAAEVSKRSVYQHFGNKDALILEHLQRLDPEVLPVLDDVTLTPRQRLLAVFEVPSSASGPTPLCPFIGASVEIADAEHVARVHARDYKRAVAVRLAATARQAGAVDPELLGEQLALLLDGASTRTRALGAETLPLAAGIAERLIDGAVPAESAREHEADRAPTPRPSPPR